MLVCASAVGIYGPRGAEPLDETTAPGTGFLAEVCRAWEAAADPARAIGIRQQAQLNGVGPRVQLPGRGLVEHIAFLLPYEDLRLNP